MGHRDGASLAFSELRKESQDLYNQFHSIAEDTAFVLHQVYQSYSRLPLIPNMRCGAWYTDPDTLANIEPTLAGIKRTRILFQVHRRTHQKLELQSSKALHVLPLICAHAGLLLVDSSMRAGKHMPDALSKTVPIWCAVINRSVLKTAPNINIERKLDGWADDLAASFYVLPKLQYPLRPIWITHSTTIFPKFPDTDAERRFCPLSAYLLRGRFWTSWRDASQALRISRDRGMIMNCGVWASPPLNSGNTNRPSSAQSVTNYQPSFKPSHPPQTHSTRTDLNYNASLHPIPIQHVHGRLSIWTTHDISSPLGNDSAVHP
ncbi:initiator tRNA phosphoribosyl transferase-domain-containing protein [Suillus discolor]|uniref:Initiator tRNA phosphoribosyl transferase-domain-containing protein n=1 Tax=Suillus discolor TaxID=1912936 RepID=A0A9P7F4A8_9AGAM|nr:initiator tRNA phosphoribosyl transferase-domain-containing protein [Suillus discolor]KAG2104089.1 initiator tRNA phosphoribosyl transferase-domain-containing protein [Suillus discolor]